MMVEVTPFSVETDGVYDVLSRESLAFRPAVLKVESFEMEEIQSAWICI